MASVPGTMDALPGGRSPRGAPHGDITILRGGAGTLARTCTTAGLTALQAWAQCICDVLSLRGSCSMTHAGDKAEVGFRSWRDWLPDDAARARAPLRSSRCRASSWARSTAHMAARADPRPRRGRAGRGVLLRRLGLLARRRWPAHTPPFARDSVGARPRGHPLRGRRRSRDSAGSLPADAALRGALAKPSEALRVGAAAEAIEALRAAVKRGGSAAYAEARDVVRGPPMRAK